MGRHRSRFVYSDDALLSFIEQIKGGKSINSIIKEYRVSYTHLRGKLKAFGFDWDKYVKTRGRPGYTNISEEDIKGMKEKEAEGWTRSDIASHYQIASVTLRKYLGYVTKETYHRSKYKKGGGYQGVNKNHSIARFKESNKTVAQCIKETPITADELQEYLILRLGNYIASQLRTSLKLCPTRKETK